MMSAFAEESLLRLKSRWKAGSFNAVPMKLRSLTSQYSKSKTGAAYAPGAVTEQRCTESDNDACTVDPQVVDFRRRWSVLDNLEAHARLCVRAGLRECWRSSARDGGKRVGAARGPSRVASVAKRVCGVLRTLVQALGVRQARETAGRGSQEGGLVSSDGGEVCVCCSCPASPQMCQTMP